MDTPELPRIDTTVAHSARIWNYWLGGRDNYEVDRVAGEQYKRVFPGVEVSARQSRYFLVRAIRYLAGEAGMRQFLDVGTGLPTVDNTHEVAQRIAPEARVVYVDNDPMVLAHAHALLTSAPQGRTAYVDADLRQPEAVLARAGKELDLDRPVALILSDVMGHIADTQEAYGIVRAFVRALPPGSHLMLSHAAGGQDASLDAAQEEYNNSGAVPHVLRTPAQIAGFFDGLDLVEPGLVRMPDWRPDIAGTSGDEPVGIGYGAVARVR